MAKKNSGDPAFPTTYYYGDKPVGIASGMSLRDYFAGQALIAIGSNDHVDGRGDAERHAVTAYQIADALIAERAK